MTITVPVAIADPSLPLPDPADRATFTARKLVYLDWEKNVLAPGAMALGTASYNNALDAQGSATAASGSAGSAATQAGNALTQAGNAAASAASALTAPGTSATSTTSMTPAKGSVSFTLAQTGKAFVVGQWVTISDSVAPATNFAVGPITSFTPGTGAITVDRVMGIGSVGTSWVIAAASTPGISGSLPVTTVSGTTQTAVAGNHYVLNNVAATAVTMPTTLVVGDPITISPNNGLYTNTVDFGVKTVRGHAGTATGVVTLDAGATMQLVAIDTTTWRML